MSSAKCPVGNYLRDASLLQLSVRNTKTGKISKCMLWFNEILNFSNIIMMPTDNCDVHYVQRVLNWSDFIKPALVFRPVRVSISPRSMMTCITCISGCCMSVVAATLSRHLPEICNCVKVCVCSPLSLGSL